MHIFRKSSNICLQMHEIIVKIRELVLLENLYSGSLGFGVEEVVGPGPEEGGQGGRERVPGGVVVGGVGRGVVAGHWRRREVLVGGGRLLLGEGGEGGGVQGGEGGPLVSVLLQTLKIRKYSYKD